MPQFSGQSVIITGAASGIGWASAVRFMAQGATVALCDLDQTKAQTLLSDHHAAGHSIGESYAVGLDVSDVDAVGEAFARICARLPNVTTLINSAGIREIIAPLDLDAASWAKVLEINLNGSFFCAQALARYLVAQNRIGSIVNVASTAGLIASKNRAAYVASKHGVVGLTRQLAYDWGAKGIRVNAVAPGVTRTAMTEAYFDDPAREAEILLNFPLGRVGRAEDVAAAITFLASDDASFITGVVLPVDGGNTAGKR